MGLSTWIERNPRACFAAFALLHAALWTILPSLLYPNLPLDLIEALTYGREWQLGYDKLPPLPWWLVEIVYRVGGADFAYYLLAQLCVLAAFALVWATALPLVGPAGALASVLIVDGLHYFNFTAPKFNHDVMQLPFWALAGFSFHAALRTGRLLHWAGLGLALGLAVWAKYFVVVLAVPLVLFLLIDSRARRALTRPGPYLAAIIALLIAEPHLSWLIQNDFLPFNYASARAAPSRGFFDHILRPLFFAVAQFFWFLPSLLIALPLLKARRDGTPSSLDRPVISLLTFGPAAFLLAMSMLTGRALITMWGYPLWLFAGLWIVMELKVRLNGVRLARIIAIWGGVTAVYALAFIAQYTVLLYFDNRYRASLFPGDQIARELTDRFGAATGRAPAYVISEMWLGGNISHYSPERPRVLIDGNPSRAPWIDLADLRKRGAIVAWIEEPSKIPGAYAPVAGNAVIQPPITFPFRRGDDSVTVGWAILKPQ
jgi:4-amino-4-deoxy-L-arabinose transferase-like glycosyltransferase